MAAKPELLVLASASTARAALLRAAGLAFAIRPALVDEAAFKQDMRAKAWSAIEAARGLAIAKAMRVSESLRGPLAIGADQILSLGDVWFDKPRDLAEARTQLTALRGRTHMLATAVCVAQDGDPVWQGVSEPQLTMRPFSDAFLDDYLAAEGESLLQSVGGYRLEGMGAQLFERINGDYFAVLGLPLLELLGFLRERGAVPT